MINTKETLKKLHSKFPLLSLDELFKILDCYVEENCLWTKDITWSSEPKPERAIKTYPYTTTLSNGSDGLGITKIDTRTYPSGDSSLN